MRFKYEFCKYAGFIFPALSNLRTLLFQLTSIQNMRLATVWQYIVHEISWLNWRIGLLTKRLATNHVRGQDKILFLDRLKWANNKYDKSYHKIHRALQIATLGYLLWNEPTFLVTDSNSRTRSKNANFISRGKTYCASGNLDCLRRDLKFKLKTKNHSTLKFQTL